MNKELKKVEYFVSGPNFENYRVLAFNIFEAAAISIRENKPKSLGFALHAWGDGIEKDDFMLLSIPHLIENYNLGNTYVDLKNKKKNIISFAWYKKLFR